MRQKWAKIVVAALALGVLYSCATPAPAADGASSSANPYLGSWKGTGSDGKNYIFTFKNETEWECFMEISGIRLPFYGGTYTYAGSEAALTATKEFDSNTNGWMQTTLPAVPLIAERNDSGLQPPTVFTDALLKKQ
jgi:hypothetical protein